MERFNSRTGKSIRSISDEVKQCFMDYCWPDNVRELENTTEHVYVTCQGHEIGLFDLPPELRMTEFRAAECRGGAETESQGKSAAASGATTRDQLVKMLESCGWSKAEAARRLGVNHATIWRKMKQWASPWNPLGLRTTRPDKVFMQRCMQRCKTVACNAAHPLPAMVSTPPAPFFPM